MTWDMVEDPWIFMDCWRRECPDQIWVFSRWERDGGRDGYVDGVTDIDIFSDAEKIEMALDNWPLPPSSWTSLTFNLCDPLILPLFSNTWTHAHHQALALAESFSGVYSSLSALLSLTYNLWHSWVCTPDPRQISLWVKNHLQESIWCSSSATPPITPN